MATVITHENIIIKRFQGHRSDLHILQVISQIPVERIDCLNCPLFYINRPKYEDGVDLTCSSFGNFGFKYAELGTSHLTQVITVARYLDLYGNLYLIRRTECLLCYQLQGRRE